MLRKASVRVLHAGSIATGIGAVATAADVTFFGGAGSAIAVALSGIELFKKSDEQTRDFAKRFAEALDKEVAASGLKGDRLIHVFQMLEKYRPSDAEVAAADKDAGKIVEGILKRIADDEGCGPEHRTREALNDFRDVITPALAMALEPVTLAEAVETEGLKRQTAQEQKIDRLLAMAEEQGESNRLRAAGITEDAIFGYAARAAGETEDLAQAWSELQNLLEIALDVQAKAAAGTNHGDLVDEVLQRAAERSRQGDNKGAVSGIEAALAEHQAQAMRLLESGANYALLDGDTEQAAGFLVQKADMEAGGQASVTVLRSVVSGLYLRNRDKGTNLMLRLAIDFAQVALKRASTDKDTGHLCLTMGNALLAVGQRESAFDRLEEGAAAYRQALAAFTREQDAFWCAETQMNLGNALRNIGTRQTSNKALLEAVDAYQAALDGHDREKNPKEWANAQMNLGTALFDLAERDREGEHLEEAISAFRASLEEITPTSEARNWAGTQMNLGNALRLQGGRQNDVTILEQAAVELEKAFEVWTHEKHAVLWAMAKMNLGSLLLAIAVREEGTKRLDLAKAAYTDSMLERSEDKAPLDWAMVQANLCGVELAYFTKTSDTAHLDEASFHANNARRVFVEAGATQYVAFVEKRIAEINSLRPTTPPSP